LYNFCADFWGTGDTSYQNAYIHYLPVNTGVNTMFIICSLDYTLITKITVPDSATSAIETPCLLAINPSTENIKKLYKLIF
jgi:hypothetical protein